MAYHYHVSGLGFIGLLLSRRAGFPDFWDAGFLIGKDSSSLRLSAWFMVSSPFSLTCVIPRLSISRLPTSLPFYAYGATLLEILLRLFAVTSLVWLFSNLIFRGRWQAQVFWVAAVIAALYEPLPYLTNAFQYSRHARGVGRTSRCPALCR